MVGVSTIYAEFYNIFIIVRSTKRIFKLKATAYHHITLAHNTNEPVM